MVSSVPRTRPRVLVVEDEYLVALTLEDMLLELGCDIVGPYSTVTRALEVVGIAEIDAAILDFLLQRQDSFEVGEALRSRDVPFVLATGWPVEKLPAHWRSHAILPKPFQIADLQHTMEVLLPDHRFPGRRDMTEGT
jgi:CheY-like chemotaxis protein